VGFDSPALSQEGDMEDEATRMQRKLMKKLRQAKRKELWGLIKKLLGSILSLVMIAIAMSCFVSYWFVEGEEKLHCIVMAFGFLIVNELTTIRREADDRARSRIQQMADTAFSVMEERKRKQAAKEAWEASTTGLTYAPGPDFDYEAAMKGVGLPGIEEP